MKYFVGWTVAALLASPLLAATAYAFNTLATDDSADTNTSSSVFHAIPHDQALTDDNGSAKDWVHKEGNFSFGMRVEGSNPSDLGGNNPFLMGGGLPNNAAARSFEDSIPKP